MGRSLTYPKNLKYPPSLIFETGSLIDTVTLLKGSLRESDCALAFFKNNNEIDIISNTEHDIFDFNNNLFYYGYFLF